MIETANPFNENSGVWVLGSSGTENSLKRSCLGWIRPKTGSWPRLQALTGITYGECPRSIARGRHGYSAAAKR